MNRGGGDERGYYGDRGQQRRSRSRSRDRGRDRPSDNRERTRPLPDAAAISRFVQHARGSGGVGDVRGAGVSGVFGGGGVVGARSSGAPVHAAAVPPPPPPLPPASEDDDSSLDEEALLEVEDADARDARLAEESRARRAAILARHSTTGAAAAPPADLHSGAVAVAQMAVATDPAATAVVGAAGLAPAGHFAVYLVSGDDDISAGGGVGAGGGGGASGGAGGVGAERDGGLLDADDADGYMRLRVGEILGGRYLVLGVRGRGMFSSVLHCKDMQASASALSESAAASAAAGGYESAVADALGGAGFETTAAPVAIGASGALRKTHAALATGSYATVAVKVLRANDVMRRAGEKEVDILRTLATADPHGRYHCVKLLHFFDHCGHLCLAFEPLEANLKEVQDKFGAGVGLP